MDKRKTHVAIDHNKCAPCQGLVCVGVCPQGILEQDANKKPRVVDEASCSRCGVCADLCPANAIEVKRK